MRYVDGCEKYPVRMEFKYNKTGSWKNGSPFTIMTVYPHDNEPIFVLKGGSNDIDKWLRSWGKPCMVYYSYWHHKTARGGIRFENFPGRKPYLFSGVFDERMMKAEKTGASKNHRYTLSWNGKTKTLRRFPTRFPDEVRELLVVPSEVGKQKYCDYGDFGPIVEKKDVKSCSYCGGRGRDLDVEEFCPECGHPSQDYCDVVYREEERNY